MDLKEIDMNMRNRVDSAQDNDYSRALEPQGYISHGVSTDP